jgi:dolichol-phosphate mannosyltransferase
MGIAVADEVGSAAGRSPAAGVDRIGDGTWVVVPTYNERDNLAPFVDAVRASVPQARILVVDDNSPDGTGVVARDLASRDHRIEVMHRASKEGLGVAYRAGFGRVLADSACDVIVQMDCDFSHDPRDLRKLIEAVRAGADLAIGSRYVPGGSTPGWGLKRRAVSRAGSLFARVVLNLPHRDLTGGFKAWRPDVLRRAAMAHPQARGYGFQIEMTWLAIRSGATVVELPITFRDREAGVSKMTGAIVREALVLVIKLRWGALKERFIRPAAERV